MCQKTHPRSGFIVGEWHAYHLDFPSDWKYVKTRFPLYDECLASLPFCRQVYDIINKKFLLESEISDGALLLKNGERVKRIVLPRIEWVDMELASFLERAKERGIKVFTPDGVAVEGLGFIPEKMDAASFPKGEICLSEKNPYILTMQKSYPDYDIFMLVNSSEEEALATANISDNGSKYRAVNLESYSTEARDPTVEDGYARFELCFAPLEAKLIMRYKDKTN